MAEAIDLSLSHLSRDDIHSLVAYLRSVPPQRGDLPAPRTTLAAASPTAGAASEQQPLG